MTQTGKKRVLGRGLNALLTDHAAPELLAQAAPIPISKIRPNRFQPRKMFDDAELSALTDSIRQEGILMPVLVRPHSDGYELIAGERRWRAAQAAGLLEVPAVVRDVDDQQALELAIIENEQRDDLTAIESARAYQRLMQDFGLTQQQVAERVGTSRTQVSNLIRLLQLPEPIQKMIEKRQLDMGHARPLVGVSAEKAEALARQCVERDWSARQMERNAKQGIRLHRREKPAHDADILALQESLSRTIGLPVTIRTLAGGSGELVVRYTQLEELDGVIARLRRAL